MGIAAKGSSTKLRADDSPAGTDHLTLEAGVHPEVSPARFDNTEGVSPRSSQPIAGTGTRLEAALEQRIGHFRYAGSCIVQRLAVNVVGFDVVETYGND